MSACGSSNNNSTPVSSVQSSISSMMSSEAASSDAINSEPASSNSMSSSSVPAGGFEASINDFLDYNDWSIADYSIGNSSPALGGAHQAGDERYSRKVLMNNTAMNSSGEFAEGSIIIKETFTYTMKDNSWSKQFAPTNGLLAMVKRGGGFNAEHNGWEWFILETDLSSVIAQGAEPAGIAGCNACHSKADSLTGGMDYSFPKPTEVIVEPSIFADYQSWDLAEFDTSPSNLAGGAHVDDASLRRVYQKQILANPTEAGDFGYPIGTVLVKDISQGDDIVQIVAMVKRGGNFDPANGNWEYFMLDPSDPTTIVQMDGQDVRGAIPMCIGCHSGAKDDAGVDFIFKHSNAPFNTNTAGEFVITKSMLSDYTSWQVTDYATGSSNPNLGAAHGATNNEIARQVFENSTALTQQGSSPYAMGSVLVKEVFTTKEGEKEFTGTFAMVKRGGNFNPDKGGWEWFRFDEKNNVAARGEIAGCIGCHGLAVNDAGIDYTFNKPSEFIATVDDFKDYKSWTKIDEVTGDNPANNGAHTTSGIRKTYKKQPSASPYVEAGEYPIGTILVKEITNTSGAITAMYAMVKRGGNFNQDGGGWEWFVPNNTLTNKGSQGASTFCGGCHKKAGDTTQTDPSFLGADYSFYKKDDPVPLPTSM